MLLIYFEVISNIFIVAAPSSISTEEDESGDVLRDIEKRILDQLIEEESLDDIFYHEEYTRLVSIDVSSTGIHELRR